VEAALLLQYAENDARVNATGLPWVEALKAVGKRAQSFVYPGTEHAFHNDTSAERYDRAAAELSWRRTLEFFAANVGAGSAS
jgi:carboxymethylenebutenolidase